jgi:hypothetical protein
VYRYTSPTCVFRKFADDMSHCPSKLINEEMHCCGFSFLLTSKRIKARKHWHGLFISTQPSKRINEQMHCLGLFKTSKTLQK